MVKIEAIIRPERVSLVVEALEKVGCGGCVVTYGQGQIDATIGRQIERVVDLLLPLKNERKSIRPKQSINAEINGKSMPSGSELVSNIAIIGIPNFIDSFIANDS